MPVPFTAIFVVFIGWRLLIKTKTPLTPFFQAVKINVVASCPLFPALLYQ